MKLIVFGIIIVLLIIAFFLFRPGRDTSLHKNMRPLTNRIILLIILVCLGAALFFFIRTLRKEGAGILLADKGAQGETAVSISSEEDGDVVIITVSEDRAVVGKKMYTDPSELKTAVYNAAHSGKKIRLVDDYARADLYTDIKKQLSDYGVADSLIEEIREP